MFLIGIQWNIQGALFCSLIAFHKTVHTWFFLLSWILACCCNYFIFSTLTGNTWYRRHTKLYATTANEVLDPLDYLFYMLTFSTSHSFPQWLFQIVNGVTNTTWHDVDANCGSSSQSSPKFCWCLLYSVTCPVENSIHLQTFSCIVFNTKEKKSDYSL